MAMNFYHKKTHRDQIWTSHNLTVNMQQKLCSAIADNGFVPVSTSKEWKYCQNDLPVLWHRGDQIISLRVEDSLFLEDPEAWTRPKPNAIISDNIPLVPIAGNNISLYPEHMHVFYCAVEYQDRTPTWTFNCFMNRISGDRSIVFYELLRRDLLKHGLISFNCFRPGDNRNPDDLADYTEKNYDWQYESAELQKYSVEHELGRRMIPYNNIEPNNLSIEQAIVDSKISLILETYISDNHIVVSEKIFRAIQTPRPWLLYCSPRTVEHLRSYGFDVLDDYVDHRYDSETTHFKRILLLLDQLEIFVTREYSQNDYERFKQAAKNNQQRLKKFEQDWPAKFDSIIKEIKNL